MYPLAFPLGELADAREDDLVLDPFCGRGTTLYAARLRGLDSVGIDLNPVAVAIARAKLASTSVSRVMQLVDELRAGHAGAEVPGGRFWTLAYAPRVLETLAALRAGLLECGDNGTESLLRAVILGSLHGPRNKGLPSYFSNQMPRSYATKPSAAVRFWEKRELLPVEMDVVDVLRRRVERILSDVPPSVSGRVIHGDSRAALSGTRRRFTRIITSPPYLGMRTYLPDQWLRNWFLGGDPEPQYSMDGQISSQDPDIFTRELADVWAAIARHCVPGARMTVRFGALPSVPVEPSDVVAESLRRSGVPWKVVDERPAGVPSKERRQAAQFGAGESDPVDEIDVAAVLDC